MSARKEKILRDTYSPIYQEYLNSIRSFTNDFISYYEFSPTRLAKVIDFPRDNIRIFQGKDDKRFLFKSIAMFSDMIGIGIDDLIHYNSQRDFERLIVKNERLNEIKSLITKKSSISSD